MKLSISRNQSDVKGFFGGHKGVMFKLTAKAAITNEERALIERYKVSSYVLVSYNLKNAKGDQVEQFVTVQALIDGLSVDTDSVQTLLELEKKCKESCQNLKDLLSVMSTFGGQEVFEI